MGRNRKFSITYIKDWMVGFFTHNKQDCIAEVYGVVDSSGSTYIGKGLIGKKTVTYVLKDGIIVKSQVQENPDDGQPIPQK